MKLDIEELMHEVLELRGCHSHTERTLKRGLEGVVDPRLSPDDKSLRITFNVGSLDINMLASAMLDDTVDVHFTLQQVIAQVREEYIGEMWHAATIGRLIAELEKHRKTLTAMLKKYPGFTD